MIKIHLGVLLAILLSACAREEKSSPYKELEVSDIEQVEIDLISLGFRDNINIPFDMAIDPVNDVFLIADRGLSDNFFHVISRNTGEVVDSFGLRGDGLGYLASPVAILAPTVGTPDSTYVLDGFENKINVYDDSYQFVRQITIPYEGLFMSARRIADRKIMMTTFDGASLVVFYDLDSGMLTYPEKQPLYPVPFDLGFIPEGSLPEFFTSIAVFDSVFDKLYLATSEIDILQVYESDGALVERLRGPDKFTPGGELSPEGYFVRWFKTLVQAYCNPLEIIGDKLIVGYSGRGPDPDDSTDNTWEMGNRLLVFDIHTLNLTQIIDVKDVRFRAGCVDPENENILYLLDANPEKEGGDIVYLDLSELLKKH